MRAKKTSQLENGVPPPNPPCVTVPGNGQVLSNGTALDLVRDAKTGHTRLLVSEGATRRVADQFEHNGSIYRPPHLSSSVARAVPLPSQCSSFGSTETLFGATQSVITTHGFSQHVADAAAYFAFTACFSDGALPATTLTITGPPPEALFLLQLLGCIVPRGLRVQELNASGLFAIIEQLRPTLLVDGRHLHPRGRHLLLSSGAPRAYIPSRNSLVDFGVAKAIYVGTRPSADFAPDFSLHVHLGSTSCLSVLNAGAVEQIIADFQPRFLDYRIRNRSAVRDSTFDLPEMESENRVIARILGACIVNAPKIQGDIRGLLQDREDQARETRFTDPASVIVDVLFALCHGRARDALRVKEIAEAAEVVLKGRGKPDQLEPRQVGTILDTLGLARKRNSDGFRILLTPEVRHHIHLLAREYQTESIKDGHVGCALCTEIAVRSGAEANNDMCTRPAGC